MHVHVLVYKLNCWDHRKITHLSRFRNSHILGDHNQQLQHVGLAIVTKYSSALGLPSGIGCHQVSRGNLILDLESLLNGTPAPPFGHSQTITVYSSMAKPWSY